MKDRFHASRLDTSSVLSDTTVTWLTTAGSARAGDEIHNEAKSAKEIRRFIRLLRFSFLLIEDRYDEITPPRENDEPRRKNTRDHSRRPPPGRSPLHPHRPRHPDAGDTRPRLHHPRS